jgi:hypothetical protein
MEALFKRRMKYIPAFWNARISEDDTILLIQKDLETLV